MFEEIIRQEGQRVLGWRDVPVDDSMIGATAKAVEPVMRQIFIGKANGLPSVGVGDGLAFERKLYIIRKRAGHAIRASYTAKSTQ
jgi:glutamate synthase (ferredoxin)